MTASEERAHSQNRIHDSQPVRWDVKRYCVFEYVLVEKHIMFTNMFNITKVSPVLATYSFSDQLLVSLTCMLNVNKQINLSLCRKRTTRAVSVIMIA